MHEYSEGELCGDCREILCGECRNHKSWHQHEEGKRMSTKSKLENACLDNGWFAYNALTSRGKYATFITPPPESRQEPDLLRESNAGRVVFSGSKTAAIKWVKAHPRPGCPVLTKRAFDEALASGAPVRVSAYRWGFDFADLPFGSNTVHVTFRIGDIDNNKYTPKSLYRFMHSKTYHAIPLSEPGILAEFEANGDVVEAPSATEMWERKKRESPNTLHYTTKKENHGS